MKTIYFIFISACLLAIVQLGYAQSNSPGGMLHAANKGLKSYLNQIPKGEEQFYGFKSRDEFSFAKLGKPYPTYVIREVPGKAGKDTNRKLEQTQEWRVPVEVNGQYRAVITVVGTKGTWQAVSFGASNLAGDLNEFQYRFGSLYKDRLLLILHNPERYFVVAYNNRSLKSARVFPILSAKNAFKTNTQLSSLPLATFLDRITTF